jgi:hypothetical protein
MMRCDTMRPITWWPSSTPGPAHARAASWHGADHLHRPAHHEGALGDAHDAPATVQVEEPDDPAGGRDGPLRERRGEGVPPRVVGGHRLSAGASAPGVLLVARP